MSVLRTKDLTEWDKIIQDLIDNGVITSKKVMMVMLNVDRRHYVPAAYDPYLDAAVPIGYGATISAPHVHAMVLELMKDNLKPGARALDVGSGCGYLTACMGFMAGPEGFVVGIDHVPRLVRLAESNVLQGNSLLVGWNNVVFKQADGRLGYPKYAPYDVIHVGAATQNIPKSLVSQLAPGGRLLIPVGSLETFQFLTQVDKRLDGYVEKKRITTVKYVPLTDISSQEKRASDITLFGT